MSEIKAFEAALLKRLNSGITDKTVLKTASAAIVNLKSNGLAIDQVFVKGRPRYDRVIINGIIDPEFWVKFRDFDIDVSRFEVFPYGIINPEGFKFKVTIGL